MSILVGIVGSGIAGLTLAHLLIQRGNIQVKVSGETVLHPSGLKVLESIGTDVLEQVLEMSSKIHSIRYQHANGDLIAHQALMLNNPSVCLRRSNLVRMLAQALPENVLVLGSKLVSVTEVHDKLQLVFDGGKVEECDLLVGADGRYSKVKKCVWGPDTIEQCSGWSSIMWQFEPYTPELIKMAESNEITMSMGDNHMCGIFPAGQSSLCCFVGFTDAFSSQHGLRDCIVDSDTEQGRKERRAVADLIGSLHPDPRIKDCINSGEWEAPSGFEPYYRRMSEIELPDCLAIGKVALIGDAAHTILPLTTMNANLALESAYVCAQALLAVADGEVDTETALGLYSKNHYPRGSALMKESHCHFIPQHLSIQSKVFGFMQRWMPQQFVRLVNVSLLSYDPTRVWN